MRSTRKNQQLQRRTTPSDAVRSRRRVLVVEDRPHVADQVADELRLTGDVQVQWCRDHDAEVPCGGVVNERCPLRHGVDLLLDVRSDGGRLTEGEFGVACAGVVGVPVVSSGPVRPSADEAPWAVARCTADDAASFCRSVLDHPEPWQERRIEDLVRQVLAMRGDDVGDVTVDVDRWPGAIAVVVRSDRLPSGETCAAMDHALRESRAELLDATLEIGLSFTAARPLR